MAASVPRLAEPGRRRDARPVVIATAGLGEAGYIAAFVPRPRRGRLQEARAQSHGTSRTAPRAALVAKAA